MSSPGLVLLLILSILSRLSRSAALLQADFSPEFHLARRGSDIFSQDPPSQKPGGTGLRLTRQVALPRQDANHLSGPPTAHSDPGPLDQLGASHSSGTPRGAPNHAADPQEHPVPAPANDPALHKVLAEWHKNPDHGIQQLIDADWPAYERAKHAPHTARLAAGRHHDKAAFGTAYRWAYYAAHDRHAADPRPRDARAVQQLRVAAAAHIKRADIVSSVWTHRTAILARRFGRAPPAGWSAGTFREACARAFERLRADHIPPPARVEAYFKTSEFAALLNARDLLAPEINPHFQYHRTPSPAQRRLLEAALKERVRQLALERAHGPRGRTWGEAERARPEYAGEDWRALGGGEQASRAASAGIPRGRQMM